MTSREILEKVFDMIYEIHGPVFTITNLKVERPDYITMNIQPKGKENQWLSFTPVWFDPNYDERLLPGLQSLKHQEWETDELKVLFRLFYWLRNYLRSQGVLKK